MWLWALRLGSFLVIRIHRAGADSRFDGVRDNPPRFLLFWLIQVGHADAPAPPAPPRRDPHFSTRTLPNPASLRVDWRPVTIPRLVPVLPGGAFVAHPRVCVGCSLAKPRVSGCIPICTLKPNVRLRLVRECNTTEAARA